MRYAFLYQTSFDGKTTDTKLKAREMKRVRCNDHDK